ANEVIKGAIQALIAKEPGDTITLIRQALLSLPVRDEGLGIPLHALLAPGLYKAANELSATASSTLENNRRPDFFVLLGTTRHYYDVQIVAINKDSARKEAFTTLTEAALEKRRKYSNLGVFFHPLIISAEGLIEKNTAKDYKALQGLLGDSSAKWLDSYIALILTQARGIAATSIIA
ncbi:hypothetical protein IFR05_005056, partial [Cadophora sp. M221]